MLVEVKLTVTAPSGRSWEATTLLPRANGRLPVNRRRLRGDRRGLTLIELVLTMTILALAGALVSGALATGLRAWKSGLRSGREELVARIVLERIAAQLRAAIPAPAKRGEELAVAFDAADDRLRFVTLAAAGTAPVQVSYGLSAAGGETGLLYRELPLAGQGFLRRGALRFGRKRLARSPVSR